MTASNLKKPSEQLVRDSILKIGNVVSVSGRTVKIKVDKAKNVSHLLFNGETIKNITVGGYIKIRKGFEIMVGKIDGEHIDEKPYFANKEYVDQREIFERILEVKLVGFYDAQIFKKGIKELPLIDNECFLLDKDEYKDVHNFVRETDIPLDIGVLANDKGISINIGVNSLFASHIGIFGNTGSGKSYTLAAIYSKLFSAFSQSRKFKDNARFFLLDFNGEYLKPRVTNDSTPDNIITSANLKKTFHLSTRVTVDKYPLSHEAINDELLWIIAAEATEKTQAPFLRRSIKNHYIDNHLTNDSTFRDILFEIVTTITGTKNKEYLSLIHQFFKDLETVFPEGVEGLADLRQTVPNRVRYHNHQSEFTIDNVFGDNAGFPNAVRNLLQNVRFDLPRINVFSIIHAKIVLNFYLEIARGFSNREHIAPMLKRLEKRVQDLSKVIDLESPTNRLDKLLTVISFKDVNIHMRKVLPLLICKQLYERKKSEGDKSKYLNLIVDEAHNILSDASLRESEQWKDYRLETFEEIIKEGRKFGTFLTVSSQRPYDISPTIISQLHNYFLHRLINEKDLKAVENTISFLDRVSFESLPILPTGSCILAGLVSQVPVIVEIASLAKENQPLSDTYKPTDFWKDEADPYTNMF